MCQWLLGALVEKLPGGGKQQSQALHESTMSLLRKHVEDVLTGKSNNTQVRAVEGGLCLAMPCTQERVVSGGKTLFEIIGVSTPQEHKTHLHSRVRKGVFPERFVADNVELDTKCRGAAMAGATPLLEQSKAAGIRHSMTLHLPPPTSYSISPPPTTILAVTHADVISAALVELCADGASPTRLASGTSVPYASWTLLSRQVDACSLQEMAELSSNNNNRDVATVPSATREGGAVRGMWRLGVPDVGHPPLRKHHAAHNTIPSMKYYPKAHPNDSGMKALVGGGIGTTSHLDTIVKVVVDSR